MARTWIVLDVTNLCWRNFYSRARGRAEVGVLAAALRKDVEEACSLFGSDRLVFCFDSTTSHRKQLFPGYHRKRDADRKDVGRGVSHLFPEALAKKSQCRASVLELRDSKIRRLGYQNVFWAEGYEADDAVASACASLGRSEKAVVVSDDSDLWQLLSPSVSCYLPRSKVVFHEEAFRHRFWGCLPKDWARVKALAGDETDEITGAAGVGPQRAVKFFQGELDRATASYARCALFVQSEQYEVNLKLTTLPFPGVPAFRPQPHGPVPGEAWDRLSGGASRACG